MLFGFTNSLILTPALADLGWVISDSLVFGNSLLLERPQFQDPNNIESNLHIIIGNNLTILDDKIIDFIVKLEEEIGAYVIEVKKK